MVCINVEHMLRCCELFSVWNAVCNYKMCVAFHQYWSRKGSLPVVEVLLEL